MWFINKRQHRVWKKRAPGFRVADVLVNVQATGQASAPFQLTVQYTVHYEHSGGRESASVDCDLVDILVGRRGADAHGELPYKLRGHGDTSSFTLVAVGGDRRATVHFKAVRRFPQPPALLDSTSCVVGVGEARIGTAKAWPLMGVVEDIPVDWSTAAEELWRA